MCPLFSLTLALCISVCVCVCVCVWVRVCATQIMLPVTVCLYQLWKGVAKVYNSVTEILRVYQVIISTPQKLADFQRQNFLGAATSSEKEEEWGPSQMMSEDFWKVVRLPVICTYWKVILLKTIFILNLHIRYTFCLYVNIFAWLVM